MYPVTWVASEFELPAATSADDRKADIADFAIACEEDGALFEASIRNSWGFRLPPCGFCGLNYFSLICAGFTGPCFCNRFHSVFPSLFVLLLHKCTCHRVIQVSTPITCSSVAIVSSFPLHPFPAARFSPASVLVHLSHSLEISQLGLCPAFFTPLMNFRRLNTEYTNSMYEMEPPPSGSNILKTAATSAGDNKILNSLSTSANSS